MVLITSEKYGSNSSMAARFYKIHVLLHSFSVFVGSSVLIHPS